MMYLGVLDMSCWTHLLQKVKHLDMLEESLRNFKDASDFTIDSLLPIFVLHNMEDSCQV